MAALEFRLPHVIFELRPVLTDPGLPDENEVVIRGDLYVAVDKPKMVQEIIVRLTNQYSVSIKNEAQLRSGTLAEHSLSLLTEPQLFEGQTWIPFQFSLPSTTAPYERCKYGHVQMKLKARVKFQGFMAKDVSISRNLYLFHIAAAKGNLPDSLALRSENFNEDLGPFLLQGESAEGLMVASLVNFRFSFLHPPKPVTIEFLSAAISQTFHVSDPKKPNSTPWSAPPQILTLFHINGRNRDETAEDGQITKLSVRPIASYDPERPFAILEPGKEEAFSVLVHLPNDDHLRGTSSALSKTPIHSTHELIVTVRYRTDASSVPQEVILTKPLTIAHCHCVSSNLLLPGYEEIDTNPLSPEFVAWTRSDQFSARHSDCQCSVTAEKLLDRARELGLDRVFASTPPLEPPALPPKQ